MAAGGEAKGEAEAVVIGSLVWAERWLRNLWPLTTGTVKAILLLDES